MNTAATTPEPVPGELPARVAARVIDVLIVGAGAAALGRAIGFGFDWLVLGAALILAYFVLFIVAIGATPGKLALGLRVVAAAGGRPSLRQALVRESFTVVGAVPFVGPILALVAWVWIVRPIQTTPRRHGKHHEHAGGTRVIRV